MSLGRVVVKNSVLVLGVQVILKILAVAFSVFFVRRLGAVGFGRYSAATALVATLGILTDWGLGLYSRREMAEEHACTSSIVPDVIAIRFLLSALAAAVAPLLALYLYDDREMMVGVFVAGLGLLVYAFQTPLASALAARERFDYVSAFSLASQLVFWGLGVLFLARGTGFVGLITASLAGAAVACLLAGWALFGKLGVRVEMPAARRWLPLLASAFPFGLSGIAYVLMERFDTVLMSFLLTDAAVGWYNVPWSLLNMIMLIAQSIGVALFPSLTKSHRSNPEMLPDIVQRSVKALLIICLPIVVGGTIMADRIVTALYTEVFANSIPVLRIMLWALPGLFLGELLPRVALTLHLERQSARIDLGSAAVIVLLNLALVPTLGVIGGALALVVGRTVRLALFQSLIGRGRLAGPRRGRLLRVSLSAAVMGMIVLGLRWVTVLDAVDPRLGLLLVIGVGGIVYVLALLASGGVERRELSFLHDVTLARLARKRTG